MSIRTALDGEIFVFGLCEGKVVGPAGLKTLQKRKWVFDGTLVSFDCMRGKKQEKKHEKTRPKGLNICSFLVAQP
jgi:hypothetical protein